MRMIICLLATCALSVGAADEPVELNLMTIQKWKEERPHALELYPENGVYGVKWGTSTAAFKKQFGIPAGTWSLSRGLTGLSYGRNHMFMFEEDRLVGVDIAWDWGFSTLTPKHPFFDEIKWRLSNGIHADMSVAAASKRVRGGIRNQHYFTENFRVTFSIFYDTQRGPNVPRLAGVRIHPKRWGMRWSK